MTRRRAIALVFGTLTLVFVLASILTVVVVRDRLVEAVDDDLRSNVATFETALENFELALEGVQLDSGERALIILDGREEVGFVPAASNGELLPRPDLSASSIVARVGEPFDVGSVEGDTDYRVLTTELDDGRYLAIAEPLDDLKDVLGALSRLLLLTLFAVVVVLGLVFWFLLRASLRPYDDMIETARAIADGDLDRRAAPASTAPEIEQLTTSLNTMLDRIQASFVAKEAAEARLRQFVADASHELRTPLTSISGYSELYLSGTATDEEAVRTQMTRINDEAARLTRLVGDLLTLARLDEEQPLASEPVDLAQVARDTVTDQRAAAPDSRLALSVPDGGEPATVIGDGDALRQVATNLIANARQHTPEGTTVTVTVEVTDGLVGLRVSDDGPGMDERTAARVFDRFYRADTARGRASGSIGLGLPIAHAIVTAHDGRIDVDTAPGRGTTFTVALPRAGVAQPTTPGSRSTTR